MLINNITYKEQANITKKASLFLFAATMFLFTFTYIPNASHAAVNKKYAAFIMDADTGLILHRENANKSLYPASLTKMMTLILTFDALDNGKLRLNSRISISKHAASMIPSKLGLKPGSTIRVKDAIYALSTKSANDIAVALAERLGGSEKSFAIMMTKKARKLGMTRTRFKNASGLHDPRQVTTARDMARLGRVMVTTYKKHYHYFSKKSFTYNGKIYRSHNKLMNTYVGMDGLKTGYIRQSGFNLVASAVRHDRRLVGVVLGGKTGKSRNAQMEKLLDRAFLRIGTLQIANYKTPIPRRKPIYSSTQVAFAGSYLPPTTPEKKKPTNNINQSRWAMLNTENDDSMFSRMIGQGDYDIEVRNRIETGLIAISAQMGEDIPDYILSSSNSNMQTIQISTMPKKQSGKWAIQIGAFSTRESTNKAITKSIKKLPAYLNHNKSIVAPSKTSKGWIFKGRLYGYTKESANDACRILNDCITISPKS